MSKSETLIQSINEVNRSGKSTVIKYTTTDKDKQLKPEEYAKKKFNIANGSHLELASMGGHIKANVLRAQMKKNKDDEKYFQKALDEFDKLYKGYDK